MSNLNDMDNEINNYRSSFETSNANVYQNSMHMHEALPWYYSIPWLIFSFLINIISGIFFLIGRYQYTNGNKSPLFIGVAFFFLVITVVLWVLALLLILLFFMRI